MPKLYEYLGIKVYFYAGDHQPIHVHGLFQDNESKAEILMENGKIKDIRFIRVKGTTPLPPAKQRDFEMLVEHEAENIVRSWKEFELHGTHPKVKKITRKIK